jgi:hypothetical protein
MMSHVHFEFDPHLTADQIDVDCLEGMRLDDVIKIAIEKINDLQKQIHDLQDTVNDIILTGTHEKNND